MKKVNLALFVVLTASLFLVCPSNAEVGVTDTEIVIGTHLDLSGPAAAWGTGQKPGMEMKAEEINKAGGIYGRKIRLVIEDNGYDPKKAIMATNKMINKDKVFCIIGVNGSATGLASKPILSKKKIPQMFPLAVASGFWDPYDRYSFGGFTPAYDNARAIVKYFAEEKKYKRFGLFYQDDELGIYTKRGVTDQLETYNLKLTAAESYKRGATDFSSQISKLKKADVQVIVLATVIRETVGVLKETQKIGWKVDVCGLSQATNKFIPMLAQKAGISADGYYGAGLFPVAYKDSSRPAVQEWFKKYMLKFEKPPFHPSIAGYIVLYYFELAAKKAGKDLTREKLVDALETFTGVEDPIFGHGPVTFTNKNHQGAKEVIMQQIQGGKYVPVSGHIDFRK